MAHLVFRVPTEDPSGASCILPRHEFMRIVQNSRVISKEEREFMEERAKREKEAAMVSYPSDLCHSVT